MPIWMQNFRNSLEYKPSIILHGNVRDFYIDDNGRIYENLTSFLTEIASSKMPDSTELIFYDPLGSERVKTKTNKQQKHTENNQSQNELDGTTPTVPLKAIPDPTQVLADWQKQLTNETGSRLFILFYLDKLISYKTSYQKHEDEILLRLEKIVENISLNNRVILVALQDSLIPTELYTNSPKTTLIHIPLPSKNERLSYLLHRMGDWEHFKLKNSIKKEQYETIVELVADLTDGLYLRDLDNIVKLIQNSKNHSISDIRRYVNKYRVGEQQDYWGGLGIEKLDQALNWFEEVEGVKEQKEALIKVRDMLYVARAGISGLSSGTTSKPKGILFFAGPTGVGKTFIAKKLAKFLFGTEEAFLRFDMSEFKEEHTISKLIGSPPGYVGHERGGLLTNSVRERPFAVILFDEIEKAHPKIMDIFLQLLDDGRLTDSRGQTIFFTETVIVFTSNLGGRTNDSRNMGLNEQAELKKILEDEKTNDNEKKLKVREHFLRSVEDFFMYEISRPELLNRIGSNIIPFNYIQTAASQTKIINSHLSRIEKEFADRHRTSGFQLSFDQSTVSKWIVDKYKNRIGLFGGRGITNAIDEEVMIHLAREVLRAELSQKKGLHFRVRISKDEKIEVRPEPK